MGDKKHWETVYKSKKADEVSWFQQHDAISLQLLEKSGIAINDAIIDIGGGASTLVDDLLARGYSDLSVLDISGKALDVARQRLGERASVVNWLVGDMREIGLPEQHYALWHDRAVFHFLVETEDRQQYIQSLIRSILPLGHVIIATFAEDGPEKCSGLPVRRYSVSELQLELGNSFTLLNYEKEVHRTPSSKTQQFNYCLFRKSG